MATCVIKSKGEWNMSITLRLSKISSLFRVLATISMFAVTTGSAFAGTKLIAGGGWPAGHPGPEAMEIFASEVARLTKGEITVANYPGSQLAGAFEAVDAVISGQMDISLHGPEWFARVTPEIDVINLPFLVSGSEQAYCIIDGEFGDYLTNKVEESAGLIVLGWMSNGARHLTNNVRPIKAMEDIAGLKVRTPPSEMYLGTFRLLGANAVTIDIKELYQALQQGVVDGQENPYGNIEVRKFDEVQKYLSNTGHFYAYAWVVMNKSKFDSLSAEHQAALREAAFRATHAQRAMMDRSNNGSRATLESRGMQYDEIPASELNKIREAVAPLYDELRKKIGAEAINIARESVQACS